MVNLTQGWLLIWLNSLLIRQPKTLLGIADSVGLYEKDLGEFYHFWAIPKAQSQVPKNVRKLVFLIETGKKMWKFVTSNSLKSQFLFLFSCSQHNCLSEEYTHTHTHTCFHILLPTIDPTVLPSTCTRFTPYTSKQLRYNWTLKTYQTLRRCDVTGCLGNFFFWNDLLIFPCP